MDLIRCIAVGYAIVLLLAALSSYVPGLTDAQGRVFGIFALTIYSDLLHLVSAAWAAVSAYWSRRCFRQFPQAVRHALLPRRAAGAGDGLGLSRSRHPPLWRAEPAARLQDPREPAAPGARRLCDVCGLRSCRATSVCRMSPALRPLLRRLRYPLLGLAVLVVLAAAPILYVETSCQGRRGAETARLPLRAGARASARGDQQLSDLSRVVDRARLRGPRRRHAAGKRIRFRLLRAASPATGRACATSPASPRAAARSRSSTRSCSTPSA